MRTRRDNPAGVLTPLRMALAAIVVCALAAGVFVFSASGGGFGHEGLGRAWRSGQFRLFLLVGLISLFGVALSAAWLTRLARRGGQPRPGGQDGTVIIEFAMVLPIALVLVLLMVQASLLMGGYLCVNYASFCAARSAVVYVPQQIGSEMPNELDSYENPAFSKKLWRIQRAAAWALIPVGDGSYDESSGQVDILVDGLEDINAEFGGEVRFDKNLLARKLAYAMDHTDVRIDQPMFEETYGEHEDLRVFVRHDLALTVPFANRILGWLDNEHFVDFGDGRCALEVVIETTLPNEGVADTIETEEFPDD